MKGIGTRGSVLVVTVLVLLALQLLAHGVLLLATRHLAASRADVGILRARAAARGAVISLPLAAPGPSLEAAPVGAGPEGASGGYGGVSVRWRVRRLTREAWLGEAWARVLPSAWELREARLFWRLDPAGRAASFTAVAESADLRLTDIRGTVRALDGPEPCGPWTAVLDTLFSGGLPAMAPLTGEATALGPLGPLGWEATLAAIPASLEGRGTPEPRDSAGVCVEGPWNWGDVEPDTPCSGALAWRGTPGSLTVEGGMGQGVLVVRGDAELVGTRYRGVVLAGGDVRLRSGARVEGLVRSFGALHLDATSSVLGSACSALRSLAAAPDALRSLQLLEGAGWLPVP